MADVFDEIALRVGVEWEKAGAEMVEDFRGRISTPWPPASTPGEYPHRRTGNLQNSTHADVEVSPNLVSLTLGNSAFYAVNLKNMYRLMFDAIPGDWTGRLADRAEYAAHRP